MQTTMATQHKRTRLNSVNTQEDSSGDGLVKVKNEPCEDNDIDQATNYYFLRMNSNQVLLKPTEIRDVLTSVTIEQQELFLRNSETGDQVSDMHYKQEPLSLEQTDIDNPISDFCIVKGKQDRSKGAVLSQTTASSSYIKSELYVSEPSTSNQEQSAKMDPACEFYIPSEDDDSEHSQGFESSDSDPEYEEEANIDSASWSLPSSDSSMKSIPFTRKEQVFIPLPTDPYDIFRLIIDDEFLDLVLDKTNKCGWMKCKQLWKDLTRQELLIFIGLLIHTGTFHMNRISDYWKTHYLFNLTCFSKFMSWNRFLQIFKCLSFSSECSEISRLVKIQPIIDKFNHKMDTIYYPGINLSVYKSMGVYKGRVILGNFEINEKHKVFIKSRGISLHVLSDTSGMVFKLNVTDGTFAPQEVVLNLLHEKMYGGHAVYISELFNSIQMAEMLFERLTYCTGPLNNVNASHQLKDLLNAHRSVSVFRNGVHLFKTKKSFYISTQYDDELTQVLTPKGHTALKSKLIVMYKKIMENNLNEEVTASYPCKMNNMKWHKKLFIHVLHLAMVNAYHLCEKIHRKPIRFYNFRLDVLQKLLPSNEFRIEPETGLHALTKIQKVRVRQRKDRGRVMLRTEVVRKECKGCKLLKKRTATTYECRSCKDSPGFCMDCFCQMHSTQPVDVNWTIPTQRRKQ